MYPAGNLFIPVAHGRLEAILKEPRREDGTHASRPTAEVASNAAANRARTTDLRGAALVLHPHPLHGGTMHNKVVFRLARALNDAGLVTLRINFRGVGASSGTHDYARGERDDARAALDYLSEHYPNLPLTLAGFSFGARVGLETGIGDERVKSLIGAGTPVNMYDFGFLQECRKPAFFVHGSRDEFGDVEKLKNVVAQMPPEANARLEIIEGAEHFFVGHLDEMSRVVTEWATMQSAAPNGEVPTS